MGASEGPARGKMRRKGDLPTKICAACGRPFTWRKKWARDWEAVLYCSDRCRRDRRVKGSFTNKNAAAD